MSTPPDEPLVAPPTHPATPAALPQQTGYGAPTGYPPATPYDAPAWPPQPPPGWGTPEARAPGGADRPAQGPHRSRLGDRCGGRSAQVSTVVACTGTFDGDDWTLIVYLLDGQGSILVTSY